MLNGDKKGMIVNCRNDDILYFEEQELHIKIGYFLLNVPVQANAACDLPEGSSGNCHCS